MWSLSKITNKKMAKKKSGNKIVCNITQTLHISNAMKFEKTQK